MSHIVVLQFSEPLVRRAVGVFWRRSLGWTYVLAVALSAAAFAVMLLGGDRSWFVGVAGTVLALAIAMAVAIYVVHIRASLGKFRAMGHAEATLAMDEDGFTLASALGTSRVPWNAVVDCWQYPEFWLLFFSKAQFITLPTASLTAQARDYLRAHLPAAVA